MPNGLRHASVLQGRGEDFTVGSDCAVDAEIGPTATNGGPTCERGTQLFGGGVLCRPCLRRSFIVVSLRLGWGVASLSRILLGTLLTPILLGALVGWGAMCTSPRSQAALFLLDPPRGGWSVPSCR